MTRQTRKALYPGSFDPITLGHLDLIRRGSELFGEITVGVAENPQKHPAFAPAERVQMLQEETAGLGGVHVVAFSGLVVDYCRKNGFNVILRGIRTVSDFELEYQMALTNRSLAPTVETVFVMPSEKYFYLSSRLIKEVLAEGGDASRFLSPGVERRLRDRMAVLKKGTK